MIFNSSEALKYMTVMASKLDTDPYDNIINEVISNVDQNIIRSFYAGIDIDFERAISENALLWELIEAVADQLEI